MVGVSECFLVVLFDLFWPLFYWLSPLLLLLSLSECLALSDPGCNPLQRPVPLWAWETSCGFALPLDPPWQHVRKVKRPQNHFHFLSRERRRVGSAQACILQQQAIALDSLQWSDETVSDPVIPTFDSVRADDVIKRLDPQAYHRRLSTFSDRSYLTTVRANKQENQVLVAATDLRASFQATEMSKFPQGTRSPYVLHTVDDPHLPVVVDTGASISLTPNVSYFVSPIKVRILSLCMGWGNQPQHKDKA
jgi:hypothetical protein